MKKNNISVLVVVMVAALLGLSLLQFYWLRLSVQSNRERFRRDVNEALSTVVRQLEQHEIIAVMQQQVGQGFQILGDSTMVSIDSMGNVHWQEEKRILSRQIVGTSILAKDGFAYEIEEETFIKKSGVARKNRLSILKSKELPITSSTLDFMAAPSDSSNAYQWQLMKKSDMVNNMVNELMKVSKGRAIQDRVSQPLLDSVIKAELAHKSIYLPFLYGIKDMSRPAGALLFCNEPRQEAEIQQKGFSVRLFPTEAFGNRNILYVHFPATTEYVFHQLWGSLVAGIFFLILIIACFALAIVTIFKQKKISDITNDFIGNLTHELKTPIATVSLATEALLDPDVRQLPHLSERYLRMIKEENSRLAEQVEKVLQIARLDKGDFKLQWQEVDVHEVIENAVKGMAIQIESRGGQITQQLQAAQHSIIADRLHIANIIYNLLDNANKYSPNEPLISVKTESTDNGVRISISDNGLGISKEMQGKIFEKFFRVPTGNIHDVKGFGLGLSYVKTMVEAHQGQISVKSELQQGSTFSVFLPYQQHEA